MAALDFIFGEELFLIDEHVQKFRQAASEVRIFEGKFPLSDLSDAIFHLSLFSSSLSIFILNPWFLVDTPTDEEIQALQTLFQEAKSEPYPILLACTKKIDQRKKMTAWLKKTASNALEFKSFKDWEQEKLVSWIHQRAAHYGKKIESSAAVVLQQLEGTDLSRLSAELDKASLYVGNVQAITLSDILTVSSGASGQIFQFTEALKVRDLKAALQGTLRLLDSNEEPIKLLGMLGATVRLYLPLRAGLDQKIPLPQLAQTLGKNPYFLKQLAPSIQTHFTVPLLKAILTRLCDLDVQIKSGQIPPKTALELAVVHFCTAPK